MIKAIDALEGSSKGHESTAPTYWETVSKTLEKAIQAEMKRGRTHVKARFKTAYLNYCIDQLKDAGYRTEEITSDIDNTQLIIKWGDE